jgi:hypothetical protein
MRPLVLTCLVPVLALAGCGGSGGDRAPADAGAVIRGWAEDVRAGRFAAANRRFALPATVANGGPAITLRTAAEVDAFNRGLACGAVVTATRAIDGGRTLATFRLTERAGPVASCGTGVGHEARVTFRVRDGRITEWLRAGDAPPGSVEV